jgi:ABC-type branched-subunit amino acid transport system substrate-binding protein
VNGIPAAADVAARFSEQYGEFGTFGPPVYVASQAAMQAAQLACEAGSLDRAGVLAQMPNVLISDSILGGDIAFTSDGNVDGARFYIFAIDENGSPFLVQ